MKSLFRSIFLAFARKCPKCYNKGLFSQYLNIKKKCTYCGLDLEGYREGFAGSVVINYSISLVITFIYIVIAYQADIMSDAMLSLSGGGIAILLITLLYPVVKTFWIHLMYNSGFLKEADKQRSSP